MCKFAPKIGKLDQLDPVDFDALVALAGGVADALFGVQRLDSGAAQGGRVQVDVVAAVLRHDEAEAFLVVEELDPAFDHHAAGAAAAVASAAEIAAAAKTVAPAEAVAAAETVIAAEAVTTAEPVVTAEAVVAAETIAAAEAVAAAAETVATAAAELAAPAARRRRLGRGRVDAVDRDDLKAARRILEVADDGGALRDILLAEGGERRGVAERVAAAFKGDEAVALGGVEPFDDPFHRSLGERAGTAVIEICHAKCRYACRGADPARQPFRRPSSARPGRIIPKAPEVRKAGPARRQAVRRAESPANERKTDELPRADA